MNEPTYTHIQNSWQQTKYHLCCKIATNPILSTDSAYNDADIVKTINKKLLKSSSETSLRITPPNIFKTTYNFTKKLTLTADNVNENHENNHKNPAIHERV